ncbi:hypothetical protein GW17_00020074 [Ensete ventricosum]|nr:hypothetical protein GW17_00020074 [Ensete ventricosum]
MFRQMVKLLMNTNTDYSKRTCAYQEKSRCHEDEEPSIVLSSYTVIDPLQDHDKILNITYHCKKRRKSLKKIAHVIDTSYTYKTYHTSSKEQPSKNLCSLQIAFGLLDRYRIVAFKQKKIRMAYQGSVKPHHHILKRLCRNKWDKEHIESKPQRQKHSYRHHLQSPKHVNRNGFRRGKGQRRRKRTCLKRVIRKLPPMLPHFPAPGCRAWCRAAIVEEFGLEKPESTQEKWARCVLSH